MDIVLETADAFFFAIFMRNCGRFLKPRHRCRKQLSRRMSSTCRCLGIRYLTFLLSRMSIHSCLRQLPHSCRQFRVQILSGNSSRYFNQLGFGFCSTSSSFSGMSYVFVYDKRNLDHPKYLKNQMRMEITTITETKNSGFLGG
ncbi:hypothetical protein V1523DRAFT_436712 [Lipomyces doorenjongii]